MTRAYTVSVDPGTHPKIAAAMTTCLRAVELALEKVFLHRDRPNDYPLPSDASAFEHPLDRFVESLGPVRRTALKLRALRLHNVGAAARRGYFGELAALNLRSATPLLQQIEAMPRPQNARLTPAETEALLAKWRSSSAVAPASRSARQAAAARAVELVVDSLTCDEPSDRRKDEIVLTALVGGGSGQPQLLPILAAEIKKGETISLVRTLLTIALPQDPAEYPKTLTVVFSLTEQDVGGEVSQSQQDELVLDMYLFVFGVLTIALIGMSPVGLLLILSGVVLAAILLVAWRLILAPPDQFAARVDALEIDAPNATTGEFLGSELLQNDRSRKEDQYTVRFRWRLV